MPIPNLTFFCELTSEALQELLDDRLIADLKALHARLSLGLLDFSDQRADIVRRLNKEEIPLDAWLLLPDEAGYWLNLRNAPYAFQRYFEFKEWSDRNDLKWMNVGLDIEPDIHEIADMLRLNWRSLPHYFLRMFARFEWKRGLNAYRRLAARIQDDGYGVEVYQYPLIQDERKARSSVLQRVMGLVNLPADREVWMLYSSLVRPVGAGVIASYADEAAAIGVGSTGGGRDLEFLNYPPLSWEEFARDLRLAWFWCNDLYIFSLEGCVNQGFLENLKDFSWDYPVILPESTSDRVDSWRRSLQSILWIFSHWFYLVGAALGGVFLWRVLSRRVRRRKAGSV